MSVITTIIIEQGYNQFNYIGQDLTLKLCGDKCSDPGNKAVHLLCWMNFTYSH